MRILSLLPSATEIVCALGLKDDLAGITHECDYPPGIEREKPVVIESCLGPEGKDLPQGEVDRRIRETLREGRGVYRIKPAALKAAQPDLVLTQGLCDVCAVPAGSVLEALRAARLAPLVLSLDPTDLTGILADIRRVGEATGAIDAAGDLVAGLEERIGAVAGKTRELPATRRPRVACLEWYDPPFSAGHWVPELVELAGGRDVLAELGVPSRQLEWDAVLQARPEVLIGMPCGFGVERARAELNLLSRRPGWADLPAVHAKRVFVVDARANFSRPGPRIVDGLEQLAEILHPDLFPVSAPHWRAVEG